MRGVELVFDMDSEMQALTELATKLATVGYDVKLIDADTREFHMKRRSRKIVNEYAVTTLPFALISVDDKVTGAVYSEEGPITVDRIKQNT